MFIPSKNEAIFFADTRFVTLKLDDAHNPEDTIAPEGVRSIIDAWPALYEANFPAIDAILPHPKNSDQAYFFFRDRYTLVNITTRQKVFDAKKIIDFWPSLKQVGFNTVDTAVLLSDETAYFFRGSQYVHVTVKPGTNDDKVIGNGPKPIKSNWPVLDKASFETVDAILPSPHGRDTNFFSGSNYVKMIIHEGSANDELTGPVKPVREGWSSLVNANFY
ncbi:hypothetical protein GL218_07887 [Daldinia childiae]|nr:uncharacterized protein GL218_07887 [Daldinia childiae]KAF3069823.1 hypothetical protein GL218_07887 [Daldinia childiae]